MTFLVLDTGGDMAVLALADEQQDGALHVVSLFEAHRTLSRRLFGQIDALLRRSELTLDDLTAFAVGAGPGSFTGTRVGLTTVKTLAQVTGKPLVGIGTLDAYAAAVWAGPDGAVVPVLPARRGEVYAAVFRQGVCAEGPFAAAVPEMPARLARLAAAGPVVVCGRPDLLEPPPAPGLHQLWTPPDTLARLAARRLAAGERDDPLALVPLYVVPPAISVPRPRTDFSPKV